MRIFSAHKESFMQKQNLFFSTSQFAKLHGVNTRTLHYYDEIGLFTPSHKDENGYRRYTVEQSLAFENILAMKELGMSIKAIKEHLAYPSYDGFINFAKIKLKEIDDAIKHLKSLRNLLQSKVEMLQLATTAQDGHIEIINLKERYSFLTQVDFAGGNLINGLNEILFSHLKSSWEISNFKIGCGAFIKTDLLKKRVYNTYSGLYTEIEGRKANLYKSPKGSYLRAFCIGKWNKIPKLLKKMIDFAKEQHLTLGEYAFVHGLNEFIINDSSDYITEITIKCEISRN